VPEYLSVMPPFGQADRAVAEKLGLRVNLLMDFDAAFESEGFYKVSIGQVKFVLVHNGAQYILYWGKSKHFLAGAVAAGRIVWPHDRQPSGAEVEKTISLK
jgi:hypothetical protein